MEIRISHNKFALSKELAEFIERKITEAGLSGKAVVINFRNSSYSAEKGGYHPVEICVDATGEIQYITDFSYQGAPGMAELCKELDFDFSSGMYQTLYSYRSIEHAGRIFRVWQRNFQTYCINWQVYDEIKISKL
jgi:hypothetical protein